MTEDYSRYTQTFTAFCGADMVMQVNEIPIGESSDIEYTEYFNGMDRPIDLPAGFNIKGTVRCILFTEPSLRKAVKMNVPRDEFVIKYATEYGQAMTERFVNPVFTKRYVERLIDRVVFEEVYEFYAEDVEYTEYKTARQLNENDEILFKAQNEDGESVFEIHSNGDTTIGGVLTGEGSVAGPVTFSGEIQSTEPTDATVELVSDIIKQMKAGESNG
jgi:hypothetical protein